MCYILILQDLKKFYLGFLLSKNTQEKSFGCQKNKKDLFYIPKKKKKVWNSFPTFNFAFD